MRTFRPSILRGGGLSISVIALGIFGALTSESSPAVAVAGVLFAAMGVLGGMVMLRLRIAVGPTEVVVRALGRPKRFTAGSARVQTSTVEFSFNKERLLTLVADDGTKASFSAAGFDPSEWQTMTSAVRRALKRD